MKRSQFFSKRTLKFRWTPLLIMSGGIVLTIFFCWSTISSGQRFIDTFIVIRKANHTLFKSNQSEFLTDPGKMNPISIEQTSKPEQAQEMKPQIILDDSSKEMLKNFEVSPEPWMKSIEFFEAPDKHMGYLLIRGAGSGRDDRAVIYGTDPFHPILDEKIQYCWSVDATTTKDFFITSVMHSPCEADAGYWDIYYSWSGEPITTLYYTMNGSSFSFNNKQSTSTVELVFSKDCRDLNSDPNRFWLDDIPKTLVTGIAVNEEVHNLPKPLEVRCASAYGGGVIDPAIGKPRFDGHYINFNLMRKSSEMQIKLDINSPENVSFNIK